MRSEETIQRFLLSSPAWFVNEIEREDFLLTPALPDSNSSALRERITPGPRRRSFMALSLKIEEEKKETIVIPQYNWMANDIANLMSAFYGKLVIMHGCFERRGKFEVPDNSTESVLDYDLYPFNGNARKSTKLDTDIGHFMIPLSLYLDDPNEWQHIIPSCSFYTAALQLFSKDAVLAFVLFLSSLECLSQSLDVTDEELFGKDFWKKLCIIKNDLKGGEAFYKDLCSRLFQIGQRCAIFVDRYLDNNFYDNPECSDNIHILKREDIRKRIKAAYTLRSKYLHIGKSHGGWTEYCKHVGAEVVIGIPVIDDPDLKKMVMRSPTLVGIERILHYCLYKKIKEIVASKGFR